MLAQASAPEAATAWAPARHAASAAETGQGLAASRCTMSALSPAERAKLIRILGMLGSDFDGERASAGLLASRLLKVNNITWADVVCIPQKAEPPKSGNDDPLGLDWRQTAIRCQQFPHLINSWETEFLSGLPDFPRLSEKQKSKLISIVSRLRAYGCNL
jgi:hypothetical protein